MTLTEIPPSSIKVIEMMPEDSKPENVELKNCIANTANAENSSMLSMDDLWSGVSILHYYTVQAP